MKSLQQDDFKENSRKQAMFCFFLNSKRDAFQQQESNRSNSALQAKQYGREFSECPGFFQLALELRRGQTQPGGLQHRLPGHPACTSTASLPHCRGGVLPLLLLSP
ncbi:hypothetical protein AMECASPLE_013250 [Ameca splendens]|uniref:Uncharacterized protein n=1 Tax=Ameca splendens TaxID=208324 RepID=A0ABV1A816_9TELE